MNAHNLPKYISGLRPSFSVGLQNKDGAFMNDDVRKKQSVWNLYKTYCGDNAKCEECNVNCFC